MQSKKKVTMQKLTNYLALTTLVFGTLFGTMLAPGQTAYAAGTSYYVAPNGSDSNPGTLTKPWRTLSHAVGVAGAGDTIFMRGGTYIMGEVWIRGDRGMGGKPGQLLTIKAYPGETPVLQPGTRRMIINADYVRVEGLHLIMPWNMDAFGKGLEIINNTFTGNQPKYGAITTGGADILIAGNNIQLTPGGNTMDHGIYVKSGQRITLRNNTITGFMGYGIHVYDEHKSNDPADWAAHPIIIRDIVVEGNLVRGSSQRAGIIVAYGTNRGVEYITLENVTIRNNLFLNNAASGVLIRQGENIEISHNTIYNNGQGIDLSGGLGISVRNNIIQARNTSNGAHLRAGGAEAVTVSNNLYWPGPAQITGASDPGAVVADPQFVNPSAGDFHLRSSSPAIDAGVALSTVTSDFEGTQRPQGAGWDIGADEFGNGGSTPTFADVPFSYWAHDEIEALYQAGYIAGCSTSPLMFCPDDNMTRAESAVFVVRGVHGAGYTPGQPSGAIFGDVALSEWYAKWANQLWEDGYTAGCGTSPLIYCPLQEHTRTEGTVFFLRMLNGPSYSPPDPSGLFADVPISFWGARWIEAAYSAGLISPCQTEPELRFCPDDALDRATGAFMMFQAKMLEVR